MSVIEDGNPGERFKVNMEQNALEIGNCKSLVLVDIKKLPNTRNKIITYTGTRERKDYLITLSSPGWLVGHHLTINYVGTVRVADPDQHYFG